jgi:hypothetical protein
MKPHSVTSHNEDTAAKHTTNNSLEEKGREVQSVRRKGEGGLK